MARAMKASGVAWIGNIPRIWSIARGKNILTLLERPVKQDDGVITCFRNGEVTLRSKRREEGFTFSLQEVGYQGIEPGDLVVHGMDGFAGAIGISDSRGKGTPVLNVMDTEQNKRYLMYYLRCAAYCGLFLSLSTGIRVRSCDTNWNKLKETMFLTPPLPEQFRIAAFLDRRCAEIDSVIAATQRTIEEYKKLKQSVITQAVTKGIRPNRTMKDSGIEWIGLIPTDWNTRPLKAYIDILPGFAFSSDDFGTDLGTPLLRGINVAPGSLRWDDVVYWNKPITPQIKQFLLDENDLVVGLDRPWITDGTRAAFVTKADLPCLLLQRVCRIRSRGNIDLRFVYHSITGKSFEDSLSADTTGVSVPHISTKQIQNYIVPIPPYDEQLEICDYLYKVSLDITKLIERKQKLLIEMENYKKSLIYEYVTGKKEVLE